jgi:hypothetical protein
MTIRTVLSTMAAICGAMALMLSLVSMPQPDTARGAAQAGYQGAPIMLDRHANADAITER